MHWIPLQNYKQKKWILSVIYDDGQSYDVTDISSDGIDEVFCYANYMNSGISDGIDSAMLDRLNRLKEQFEAL